MPRMPPPSDIHLQSPRQWSPISYAFLGDAVWELYIRRLFFAPPSRPLEYDLKCKRAVKAEAQDAVLRQLMDTDFFSDDELGIVKWGRNASYGNTPQRRGRVHFVFMCFCFHFHFVSILPFVFMFPRLCKGGLTEVHTRVFSTYAYTVMNIDIGWREMKRQQ